MDAYEWVQIRELQPIEMCPVGVPLHRSIGGGKSQFLFPQSLFDQLQQLLSVRPHRVSLVATLCTERDWNWLGESP